MRCLVIWLLFGYYCLLLYTFLFRALTHFTILIVILNFILNTIIILQIKQQQNISFVNEINNLAESY
jgi:hypothetical protein